MQIPEWFCGTICAGLNLDELVSGEADIESPLEENSQSTTNLFRSEEDWHLQRGRVGFDRTIGQAADSLPGN